MATEIKGIDISVLNGIIDWTKVKKSGVEFAIIKATQGKDARYPNGFIDTAFSKNYAGAKAAGIKVGAYHFATFLNEAEAHEQAKYFIDGIKGKEWDYPLCLDLEDLPTGRNPIISKLLDKKKMTECAVAFLDDIKSAGYTPMLYTNTDWRRNKLDYGKLSDYLLWQAHYTEPKPAAIDDKVAVWQYSGTGKVDGVTGNCDVNRGYVDLSKSIAAETPPKTVSPMSKQFTPSQESPATAATLKYKDKVKVLKAELYNGGTFKLYYDVYDVLQAAGDRIVVGVIDRVTGKETVTAAVNIKNLQKVQ